MTDLQTLIRTRNEQGVSYREMERLADEAGYHVKFQTFADYAVKPPLAFPKVIDTIRGMAAALGVTERAIVLAYAESLGVDVGQVSFADLVPLSADEMSTGMRTAVLAVIREATKGAQDDASPEPGQKARGAAKQQTPPMTEQEQKAWEARERAKANARLRRNNPATGSGK